MGKKNQYTVEKVKELLAKEMADILNEISKPLKEPTAQDWARYYLAYLCNNSRNVSDYRVDGINCYYKDEFIGEMEIIEDKEKGITINFRPSKPLKFISTVVSFGNESK